MSDFARYSVSAQSYMKAGLKVVPKSKSKQRTELQKLLEEAEFLRAHWQDLQKRIDALTLKTAA